MKHKIRLEEFEKFDTEVELASENDREHSKRLTAYLFPTTGDMHFKLYYDGDCKIRVNMCSAKDRLPFWCEYTT